MLLACRGYLRAACLGLVLVTWGERAGGAPDTNRLTIARELFDQGRELMARSEPEKACGKFQESYRLDPGGGTLLNLALCNELTGRTATAWTHFRDALRWARKDRRSDRIAFAEQHIAALQPRLSRLRVVVPQSVRVPGLRIVRDGIMLGQSAWGEALAVDPGTHLIQISAPGKQPYSEQIHVSAEGDLRTVQVRRLSDFPRRPVRRLVHESEPTPMGIQRASGLALGGLGLAVTVVGAFFGIRAIERDRRADELCGDSARCKVEGIRKSREAAKDAVVSTVCVSGGAALAGTGMYLFVTAPVLDAAQRERGALFSSGVQGRF